MPALNDDEVLTEMKKMVAFIKQEALEKAREIKVKADEEFAIEKAKIVRQETTNIDALYSRKRKQVEIQKKISASNQNNKSRLKLLSLREELLEEAFEEAREGLANLTKDKSRYEGVLKDLILQALYTIMEKEVTVRCRKSDSELVQKAKDAASSEFKENAGLELNLNVTEDLPEESAGGVIIKGYGNRIVVDNTLDQRLKLLEQEMLPELRDTLFGKNPNRKHYN
ncbi:ATPase, V1/A1 complex, subunit E [Cystobasidium minutum MCA 4210]|uniref:ATPase, V1/A1 complex, subunit E n=1 Tax=Cystobasidium minutum MCA 4210 TaxID=1397322 RepID=UPI0034CE0788|eukprot:jgi/Rhomi1/161927/estExt_Genewise1Plus.C_5_t10414